jgi:signal recognition particle subunit SRP54
MKKQVVVVSVDVYRPAAIKQLETLAGEVGVDFFQSDINQAPLDIAKNAIKEADKTLADVVIVDTAGRLSIDDDMMAEIKGLQQAIKPAETFFVVDAMTGQDAANTAKAFDEAIDLTAVILSKADGDARGGAALSVKYVTGKPIKFMGMGEKVDALEVFHPDRVASRILGMGDVMSLIEDAEHKLDKSKAEKMSNKIMKGKGFNLEDLLEQFRQMRKLGGMQGLMSKMPGMGQMAQQSQAAEGQVKKMEALILSMTVSERKKPEILDLSRKKRIVKGSGTKMEDMNRLLKQHKEMQKMMKKFSGKGGLKNKMRGMQSMMSGKMPPM